MKKQFGGVVSLVFAACAFLAVFLAGASARGAGPEMVAGWSFPSAGSDENPVAASYLATGVTSSPGISVLGGMVCSKKKGAFGGKGCHDEAGFEAAAAADQAISFTLGVSEGYALSLSRIAPFKYVRSKTGATTGRWQRSVCGGPYVDVTGDIAWDGESGKSAEVPLAGTPVVGPGSNITFRLVLWGATGSSGAWHIAADASKQEYFAAEGEVAVVGAVAPTPPSIEAVEDGVCYEGRRFERQLRVTEADGDAVTTNVSAAAAVAGAYGVTNGLFYYEPAAGDSASSPVEFTFAVSDKDGSDSTTCRVDVCPRADFIETFDSASQGTYARELKEMAADKGPWMVTNLMVKAPGKNDRFFTGKSVRTQGTRSSFYMNFDKPGGLSGISLYHAMAVGDSPEGVSWTLSVSSDGGNTWDAFVSAPRTPGEAGLARASFTGLEISGNVRVRIDVVAPSANIHVNFDEIAMTDHVTANSAPALEVVPAAQTVEPGTPVEIRVVASDADGDPLALSVASEDLPGAASCFAVADATNGLFRFTPGAADVGRTCRLLFKADDGTDSSYAPAEFTVEPLWAIDLDFVRDASEDFDGLGGEREATLPRGWKTLTLGVARATGSFRDASRQTGKLGGTNMSSRANAGAYNFGAGDEDKAADRATGFLASGTVRSGNLMVRLRNTAVSPMRDFEISYDIEKYRDGSNPKGFSVSLLASPDGEHWAECGAPFSTPFGPDAGCDGLAEVPSVTKSVAGAFRQDVPCGGDLYLLWLYSVSDGSSSGNAQALAVDNVVIRARPAKTTVFTIR